MRYADASPAKSLVQTISETPLTLNGLTRWVETNWAELLLAIMWAAAAAIAAIILYLGLNFLRARLVRGLRRGERVGAWRSMIAKLADDTSPIFFVALAAMLAALMLGVSFDWLSLAVGAIVVVQIGLWSSSFLQESITRYADRRVMDRSALANAMSLMHVLIRVAVWSVVALVVLSNLGVDVTALVAGLGIGGIAIGLAAQGIFADLFASLSIVLDRPFVRGDFIVFGDHMGTIERIGIKSTRLRSLSGEQIVVSNANLLQSTIRNYQLLYERRVVFSLAVNYRTPVEKLETVPVLLRDAVVGASKTRFDRAHFKEFGDSALTFEVVYFVLSADYNVYMDTQQAINLEIARAFEAQGVEFAFPTRTVIVESPQPRAVAPESLTVGVRPSGAGSRVSPMPALSKTP